MMANSTKDDDILSVIYEDHLTCQICLSLFIKPKVLKCLHTFCESCLQVLRDSKGAIFVHGIACPVCRSITVIPPNGISGLPDNHAFNSLLDTCAAQASKAEAREVAEKTSNDAKPEKTGKQNQPKRQQDQTMAKQVKKNQTQLLGIVSHCYIAQKIDELELKPGDIITLSSRTEVENGWLHGTLNGKTGVFPANHLASIVDSKIECQNETAPAALLTHQDLQSGQQRISDTKTFIEGSPDALVGLQYIIEFQSKDEGTLSRYVCSLCNAKCDGNTLRSHLIGQKHRDQYIKKYYPDMHTQIKMAGDKKSDQSAKYDFFARQIEETEGRADITVVEDSEEFDLALTMSKLNALKCSESKADVANSTGQPKDKKTSMPKKIPKPRKKAKKEPGLRAIANYPYKANYKDELQLEVGDVILIDSTAQVDDGWLRGTINDKTGVFPENFVEIVDDKEEEEDDDEPETNVADTDPARDEVKITMVIPKMYISRVIGKKGSTLKQINSTSGAKLSFTSMPPIDSQKPGILAIKGRAASVNRAKETVESIIQGGKKPIVPGPTKTIVKGGKKPVVPVAAERIRQGGKKHVVHGPTETIVKGGKKPVVPVAAERIRQGGKKHVVPVAAERMVQGGNRPKSSAISVNNKPGKPGLNDQHVNTKQSGAGLQRLHSSESPANIRPGNLPKGKTEGNKQKHVKKAEIIAAELVKGMDEKLSTDELLERMEQLLMNNRKASSVSGRRQDYDAANAQGPVLGAVMAAGGDGDNQLPQYVELKLKVPQEAVGRVIGRQGARINEIMEKLNVDIDFDKKCADGRYNTLRIFGTIEATEQAKALVIGMVGHLVPGFDPMVDNDNDNLGDRTRPKPLMSRPKPLMSDTILEIHITNCLIGIILGKGWSNVKAIEEKTGAKLTLKDNDKAGGNFETMVIRGSPDSAPKAKAMVAAILSKIHVQDVEISSEIVSKLYGDHGKNSFTDICRGTGARIHVIEAVARASGEFKRITISGTNDAVKIAKRQLEAKVYDLRKASEPARQPGILHTPGGPPLPPRRHVPDELPRRAAPKEELFECGWCYDNEVKLEEMGACENGHLFCRACILRYCEEMIGQGRGRFSCLTDGCDCHFPALLLHAVLPKGLNTKATQLAQEEESRLANIPDLVNCPHCVYAVEMPDPRQSVFHCQNPYCRKDTCRYCKKPDHLPLTCDQVEKQVETNQRTKIENLQTEAMVRVCHKCRRRFYKTDGCNKMTCLCGATMCYICRAPNIDYNHFDRFSVASGQTRCPLYSDTDELQKDEARNAEDTEMQKSQTRMPVQATLEKYLLEVHHSISFGADEKKKNDGCCIQ